MRSAAAVIVRVYIPLCVCVCVVVLLLGIGIKCIQFSEEQIKKKEEKKAFFKIFG